jgi:5'-hydroxyaverantin dehydrogenase
MSPSIDLSALKGRSVLITGGASGLGLATTKSFAAAGAYVTIADIQPAEEVGGKIAQELTNQGHHVTYTYCDVTSWESQIKAFKAAIVFAPDHTLDVVAMFAGTACDPGNVVDHVQAQEASLEKDPAQPSIKSLDINLTGIYYSTYLALNYFRLKPRNQPQTNGDSESLPSKSLIFVSSMAGYIDYPGHSLYNAGKFGVRSLFRSIRSKAKETGVRCNLLAPWYIKTPMTARLSEALQAQGIKDGSGVTFGRIEDVVEAAGRCAADESVDGMLRLESRNCEATPFADVAC